ncbi:alpha-L-rhamnosidase C-terminal domain-containing protein [Actinomadura luteofluorescens]|uniref:alpha-L-rhamnosidase-related protein n=1 Tax=Actinomadura luteofluorescens TaxID=46163 RepID=UPI0036351223
MHASYVLNDDGTVSRSKDDNQDTDLSYGYTQRAGDQTFRPLTYVGFRYLEIAPDAGAEAGDVSAVLQHDEVTRGGRLHTSDAGVNAAYDLMARSALYGSQSQFLDTPTREKGQFLGDSVDTSLAMMGAYGERRLTRQAIREFIASQARYWPDGRLNAVYPNGDGKRDIPDYTEMFPGWIWDYYEQSGDASTLAEAYPVMSAVAGYVRRYIAEGTGLVTNLEGGSGQYRYGIIDWPATMRYGHDMDTAARTVINVLGVDVLNATARAADALGRNGDAEALRKDAGTLTGNINAKLRRSDGVYIDGLKSDGAQSTHASQIANAYALAYGVAPADGREKVESYIAGLGMQMGPMTAHRLLEALGGRPADVVTRLTDTKGPGWGNILARGGTFTWESWDAPETGQSFSHPWGATSLVEVQQTLLGVTVTAPASAAVRIRPPLTGLDRASGTVPLQRGDVGVTWKRASRGFSLDADIPVNVRAEIHVPARSAGDVHVSGPGGARFTGMKDGYAVFEAAPGTSPSDPTTAEEHGDDRTIERDEQAALPRGVGGGGGGHGRPRLRRGHRVGGPRAPGGTDAVRAADLPDAGRPRRRRPAEAELAGRRPRPGDEADALPGAVRHHTGPPGARPARVGQREGRVGGVRRGAVRRPGAVAADGVLVAGPDVRRAEGVPLVRARPAGHGRRRVVRRADLDDGRAGARRRRPQGPAPDHLGRGEPLVPGVRDERQLPVAAARRGSGRPEEARLRERRLPGAGGEAAAVPHRDGPLVRRGGRDGGLDLPDVDRRRRGRHRHRRHLPDGHGRDAQRLHRGERVGPRHLHRPGRRSDHRRGLHRRPRHLRRRHGRGGALTLAKGQSTLSSAGSPDDSWALLRTEFVPERKPVAAAVLHVAAQSPASIRQYPAKIWVNGKVA